MPELPEVQTTVNGINSVAKDHRITAVWTDYNSPHYHGSDTIKDPKYFSLFKKTVTGRTILGAERRAKNILIHLSGTTTAEPQTILIHMKMTGHMMAGEYVFDKKAKRDPWKPANTAIPALHDPFNRFIHLVFTLTGDSDKHLVLSDMRKFAKVTVVPTHTLHTSTHLRDVEPEPLDNAFNFEAFKERLALRPNAKIKPTLMDQSIIAGIGNIYADESLWRAGIHPEEPVSRVLKSKKSRDLYTAIRATLLRGIDFGGDSMSDYRNIHGERGKFQEKHRAYRKTGTLCTKPNCEGTIRRKVIAGRSGHFCDSHQKLGTLLPLQKQKR